MQTTSDSLSYVDVSSFVMENLSNFQFLGMTSFMPLNSGARSAGSVAPYLYKIVVTHQAETIFTFTGVRTRCYF